MWNVQHKIFIHKIVSLSKTATFLVPDDEYNARGYKVIPKVMLSILISSSSIICSNSIFFVPFPNAEYLKFE
jgi:hypothetical protein